MDYVCKEASKCVIDVSRRNQCQACRLRKCLEVKMNKDGKCLPPLWSSLFLPPKKKHFQEFDCVGK